MLGDSIRMNYQSEVMTALKGKASVWAPKENCRHTAFIIEKLDLWLSDKKPNVIHINVGLHDMFLNAKSDKTRHTLETYSRNLREILKRLKRYKSAKIIFATTTPVIEDWQAKSKGYKRVVRRNADVNRFNQAAQKVAKDLGVTVNDLNRVSNEAGAQKILRKSDGIHLSQDGTRILGQHVAKQILFCIEIVSDSPARNPLPRS